MSRVLRKSMSTPRTTLPILMGMSPGKNSVATEAGGKAIVGVANVDLTGFTGLIVGATS